MTTTTQNFGADAVYVDMEDGAVKKLAESDLKLPVPLIVGIALAHESPWWLVRRGRNEGAGKSLRRQTPARPEEEIEGNLSMMRHTNELEKKISAGTSYRDCFKGTNLRRTEITCITWTIQAASGASLIGYAAYFFEQGGLPTTVSFEFSMALYAVAAIAVIISWFAIHPWAGGSFTSLG